MPLLSESRDWPAANWTCKSEESQHDGLLHSRPMDGFTTDWLAAIPHGFPVVPRIRFEAPGPFSGSTYG
eukprot:8813288-Alexandrium_andersonii.AAC.1